jgi:hypothetical protein
VTKKDDKGKETTAEIKEVPGEYTITICEGEDYTIQIPEVSGAIKDANSKKKAGQKRNSNSKEGHFSSKGDTQTWQFPGDLNLSADLGRP